MHVRQKYWIVFLLLLSFGFTDGNDAAAATAKEIDASVKASLERFKNEIDPSGELRKAAKGILVIPKVIKAGFVVGGEYGEGALIIGKKTIDYYSMGSASFGLQLGSQQKDIILLFLQEKSLQDFRDSKGWKAGVDGSVALIKVGAQTSLDTTKIKDPIIGFVFGQKGLMYNLTLEGSKFTKLKR